MKILHIKLAPVFGFGYWKDNYDIPPLTGYAHSIIIPFARIQWGELKRDERFGKVLTKENIPEGFRYAAIDKDGEAFAFTELPFIYNSEFWSLKSEGDSYFIGKGYDVRNWQCSLIEK